jgi:hypothetical protein
VRDAATERVIHSVVGHDPAEAFAWAKTFGNPDLQTDFMSDIVRHWSETDPVGAQSALEQTDLPPQQRQHLQEVLERRGDE